MLNKRKIINDPVYGFINIPSDLIFDLLSHPYFQRLRRIKQLGLTHYVYPGAQHTRFQHALGAMHLMQQAIEVLRSKGHQVYPEEERGALVAILLHDIGHGPFSHTLEHSIVRNVSHEELSLLFMRELNKKMLGRIEMAIEIFTDNYPKRFLHQLVSSQLDMDRLDYLIRDSFFTGVSEGIVGVERIIKMLQVHNDELVIEAKGIYSVEKFLISRRLMYWQVYLHKTAVASEALLIKIFERARKLVEKQKNIFTLPALDFFLRNEIKNIREFDNLTYNGQSALDIFAELDDNDLLTTIKAWTKADDKILALLSTMLINRNPFRIEIQDTPFENKYIERKKKEVCQKLKFCKPKELKYLVFSNSISNNAYSSHKDHKINVITKTGQINDIAQASDISNVKALSKTVKKYFLCYPRFS